MQLPEEFTSGEWWAHTLCLALVSMIGGYLGAKLAIKTLEHKIGK